MANERTEPLQLNLGSLRSAMSLTLHTHHASRIWHGRAAADDAANTARKTFEEGTLAESLPTVEIATAEMQSLGVLNAFVRAGLASSNGDAKRQIKGGGLRVNDVAVTDEKMTLTSANLTPEGVIKLSLGRKRHVLIKPI